MQEKGVTKREQNARKLKREKRQTDDGRHAPDTQPWLFYRVRRTGSIRHARSAPDDMVDLKELVVAWQ